MHMHTHTHACKHTHTQTQTHTTLLYCSYNIADKVLDQSTCPLLMKNYTGLKQQLPCYHQNWHQAVDSSAECTVNLMYMYNNWTMVTITTWLTIKW